jgi:hypothetical protein
MPINLTTAFDPGDADSGNLTHVRIESLEISLPGKTISFTTRHGTYAGGTWTDGVKVRNVTRKKFTITGDDYDDMIAKTASGADAKVYDDVAKHLYQWLIDEGHFTGTIV